MTSLILDKGPGIDLDQCHRGEPGGPSTPVGSGNSVKNVVLTGTQTPPSVQDSPDPEDLVRALVERGFYVFRRLNAQHAGKHAPHAGKGEKIVASTTQDVAWGRRAEPVPPFELGTTSVAGPAPSSNLIDGPSSSHDAPRINGGRSPSPLRLRPVLSDRTGYGHRRRPPAIQPAKP